MAITDLTGTTWYLKEVLDFTYIVLGTYNLSFNADGYYYEYFKMTTPSDGEYKIEYGVNSESYATACTTYVGTQDTVWIDQAYRRITITGGSDSTNTDLIAFFTQNRAPLLGNPLSIGGGSSYKLIATQDYTVNTTSTSAATVGTISLGSSYYTSDKIIYVRIRDKAGARNGYFVGSDTYFFNPYPENSVTTTLTNALRMIILKTSSGTFSFYAGGTTNGYGVYGYSIDSDGDLVIRRRYNSSNSLTINGTYEVKVYALDYCPDQGNPFNYSYS